MTPRRPMTGRRPRVVAFTLLAALAASLLPALASPARAAAPNLTITSDTRYVVDPAKGRVHVTAALTAVNHLRDTKTRQFYFDHAFLAVQPRTTGYNIASSTGSPRVSVSTRTKDHTLLRIDFGKRLGAGATRTLTLTFDIVDKGGSPTRETRIGTSLVSFAAWAFATSSTPGGSVSVVWPAGFNIEVDPAALGEPKTDASGSIVYSSGRLAEPLAFFAYFVADKPNAYVETVLPVEIGGRPLEIAIRSWPDDPAWAKRIRGVLAEGLPALSAAIGLPWLDDQRLVVAEAISRSSGGYSGRYDPETGRIEIAYYADSLVVLHEAAHAWFDGRLLADRWANEGFATWYAGRAAGGLGMKVPPITLTAENQKHRIPLNAWGPVGIGDVGVEDFGYAASAELARQIAQRAGPTGLESVWESANQGIGAYQPVGLAPESAGGAPGGGAAAPGAGSDTRPVEAGAPAPDWRGLLDLLEDRTGRDYGDLWRAWVIRPAEGKLLDDREAARRRYDQVVRRAADWQLPPLVRQAMRAWQFDQAMELLVAADRVLDGRDAVSDAASAAGLPVPRALQAAFEGNGSFAAAATEADAELQTIARYEQATAARPIAPDLMQQIGLWGTTPAIDLAAAADAFAAGDLQASVDASLRAQLAWDSAQELGRNRAITILAAMLAALIAIAIIVGRIRSARRRWHRRSAARAYARELRALGSTRVAPSRAMAHRADQDQGRRGRR
jgi:hypothetical protein